MHALTHYVYINWTELIWSKHTNHYWAHSEQRKRLGTEWGTRDPQVRTNHLRRAYLAVLSLGQPVEQRCHTIKQIPNRKSRSTSYLILFLAWNPLEQVNKVKEKPEFHSSVDAQRAWQNERCTQDPRRQERCSGAVSWSCTALLWGVEGRGGHACYGGRPFIQGLDLHYCCHRPRRPCCWIPWPANHQTLSNHRIPIVLDHSSRMICHQA